MCDVNRRITTRKYSPGNDLDVPPWRSSGFVGRWTVGTCCRLTTPPWNAALPIYSPSIPLNEYLKEQPKLIEPCTTPDMMPEKTKTNKNVKNKNKQNTSCKIHLFYEQEELAAVAGHNQFRRDPLPLPALSPCSWSRLRREGPSYFPLRSLV